MVRKSAFEEAGRFDEDVKLYLEDDMLGLSLRKHGWKILFTPLATGIHEQGASSKLREDTQQIQANSARIFESKWGRYLDTGNFDA